MPTQNNDGAAGAARPANCHANLAGEYATCERCGLAWLSAKPAPACAPMSAKQLRLVLLGEAAALEGSFHAVLSMKEAGMPADPVYALKRATALRGVLVFVERCTSSRVIVDEIRRLLAVEAAAAQGEAADD